MMGDLHKALADRSCVALKIAERRDKATELQAAANAADREAAALERAALDREAAALLNGEAIEAAETEAAGRLLAKTRHRAGAARHAADIVLAEIPALQEKLGKADTAVSDAALTDFRVERDAAVTDAIEAIASLRPTLARLIAAERVRRRLIGDRFTFDARHHDPRQLWSGEHVAAKFLDSIPSRLLPDGFPAAVTATAERIAAEMLAALKGGDE